MQVDLVWLGCRSSRNLGGFESETRLDQPRWRIIQQLIELDSLIETLRRTFLQLRLFSFGMICHRLHFFFFNILTDLGIRRWRWLPFYCPFISMANSYDDHFFLPSLFFYEYQLPIAFFTYLFVFLCHVCVRYVNLFQYSASSRPLAPNRLSGSVPLQLQFAWFRPLFRWFLPGCIFFGIFFFFYKMTVV